MDRILTAWLERQYQEGMSLQRESDILTLTPCNDTPPSAYRADFRCMGLAMSGGNITEIEGFTVLIRFPPDHLRKLDPFQLLALMSPSDVFHPNISFPAICVGKLPPGIGLCTLLYQVHEIVTFQRLTPREDDALNPAACAWARENMYRFPIDGRPLKRRQIVFDLAPVEGDEQ